MAIFFCKTRVFWALTRIIFVIAVAYDIFSKDKFVEVSLLIIVVNSIISIYSFSFLVIGINEFRKKETNTSFLKIIGFSSIFFAIALVSVTIGALKSGYGFLLFVFFIWFIFIGLKDISGNHYYFED